MKLFSSFAQCPKQQQKVETLRATMFLYMTRMMMQLFVSNSDEGYGIHETFKLNVYFTCRGLNLASPEK